MEQYFSLLSANPLFAGISRAELADLLDCLGARLLRFPKGEPLFLEGDPAGFVGLVLEGAVQIVRDDFYGSRSLLTLAQPGDLFGEAFACAGADEMPVSGYAAQTAAVLWLELRKMITVCSGACPFHNTLIKNLLQVTARKNLLLNRKIRFMSPKTTREKLLAYLSDQAKQCGSTQFTIPLNRQELADYLGVERSAMSAELSKLRRDGVLEYSGARFHLPDQTP